MLFICYPGCTTCKKAQAWLDGSGIGYTYRNIKTDRPSEAELKKWHSLSGLPLQKFFNTSGIPYRNLGLKEKLPQMTDEQRFALLASNGMLVKRPLLIGEAVVLVGFNEAEWREALQR